MKRNFVFTVIGLRMSVFTLLSLIYTLIQATSFVLRNSMNAPLQRVFIRQMVYQFIRKIIIKYEPNKTGRRTLIQFKDDSYK